MNTFICIANISTHLVALINLNKNSRRSTRRICQARPEPARDLFKPCRFPNQL